MTGTEVEDLEERDHVEVADEPDERPGRGAAALDRLSRFDPIVVVGFAVGLVLRLPLIFGAAGQLNADEAIIGSVVRELEHGRFLFIFPGQHYQGTLEGFVAAPFEWVFGGSSALYKIVALAFWLAAAWLIDRAAVALADARPGLTFVLVWCWSAAMLQFSTQALMGYGSGLLLLALGYCAWGLATRTDVVSLKMLAVAGVGFGAAVWQQPGNLGTAAMFGLGALLVPVTRRLIPLVWFGGGMVVGMLPLLVYNAANDWAGLEPLPQPPTTYTDRLEIVVKELLPRNLGLMAKAGWWTIPRWVALGAMAAAALVFVAVVVRCWNRYPAMRPILVLPVVNIFVLASFTTTWYPDDARYSLSFLPALGVIAGVALTWLAESAKRWGNVAVAVTLSLIIAVTAFTPLFRQDLLSPGDGNADADRLIAEIERLGFRCALGDYWLTERITVLSDGDIVASADGVTRFPKIHEAIEAEPGRYVVIERIGSGEDAESIATLTDGWERHEFEGAAIYVPTEPPPAGTPSSTCG